MPTRRQVHAAKKTDAAFAERYEEALLIGLEAQRDELVEIADTAVDRETAQAAKVRIDARTWLLEREMRGVYGRANEQGGEFIHYVVELPAAVESVDEWLKRHGQQNQSAIASLSGVLNPDPKAH